MEILLPIALNMIFVNFCYVSKILKFELARYFQLEQPTKLKVVNY